MLPNQFVQPVQNSALENSAQNRISLSGPASVGQKVVPLVSTDGITVGQYAEIWTGGAVSESVVVASVQPRVSITLVSNLVNNHGVPDFITLSDAARGYAGSNLQDSARDLAPGYQSGTNPTNPAYRRKFGDPQSNQLGESLISPGQTYPATENLYSREASDQVGDSRYGRTGDPNAYPGQVGYQGTYSGQVGDPRLNPLDTAFTEADKRVLAFLPNYDQAVKLEMIARRKANWLQTVTPMAVNLVEAAFYGKPDMGPQKRAIVEKMVADLSSNPGTPVEIVNETHVLNSIEANLSDLKNNGNLISDFKPDDPAFPYAPRTDAGMYTRNPNQLGSDPAFPNLVGYSDRFGTDAEHRHPYGPGDTSSGQANPSYPNQLGTDPSHPYQQTRAGMQQNLDNPISAKRSDMPDPITYNAPVSYPEPQNQIPAKRT